ALPPNPALTTRLLFAWRKFQLRHAKRTFSFPGGPVQMFSVGGLLNQCMQVTGTRYLLARDVVSVDFGHTNTLTGREWVAAFEHALQHNKPYCYNPQTKRMYQDNLLLISERPGLVKVVPRSQLGTYQKAGLVSPHYVPPAE